MTNSARILVAIAVLAVAIAAGFALSGALLYRATIRDTETHLYSASPAVTVWTTRWARDTAALGRSALTAIEGSAPVVAGQTLYALGSDHRLRALDPGTGVERWAFGYGDGRHIASFRLAGPRLVLLVRLANPVTGLTDTSLVCLDPGTRLVAWDRPLETDVYVASLQATGDSVYLAVADNVDGDQYRTVRERNGAASLHPRLRAYSAADGARRWEQPLPERAEAGPVDRVVLLLTDRAVVASESALNAPIGLAGFESARGEPLWRQVDGSDAMGLAAGIVVARTGSDLALLAAGSGHTIDHISDLAPRSGPVGSVVDGDVLYWAQSDQVTAVDLLGKRRLFTTALDYPKGRLGSGPDLTRLPAVQDGHLYVGGRDEHVYSIDARTGAFEWKFPAERRGPAANYAPLRYGDLVLVQDEQLTAYRAPG